MDYAKLRKRKRELFKDSPVIEKGVNKTDDSLGGLIDNGKKVRYRDYKTYTDLLAKR